MRTVLGRIVVVAGLAAMLLAAGAGVAQSAARPAPATCSRAAARALAVQHHLGNAGYTAEPVAQVLCGAFTGRGSRAMAASLTTPGCGGTIGWVVFRRSGGSWRLVLQRHEGALLQAVGSSIREVQNVLAAGDAHCLPTGGTRSRVWRWNGSRFVVTAWKSTPPAPPPPSEFRARLAAGTFACAITTAQTVCQAFPTASGGADSLVRVARLAPDGSSTSCAAHGPTDATCPQGDVGDPAPVFTPGQSTSIGPFSCAVRSDGVRCTVTATSRGFLITADGVTPIGG